MPVSPKDLIDLNEGFDRGLVKTLDDLFVLSKLTFVRRKEHLDAFERAFSLYFFGIEIPHVAEGDLDLRVYDPAYSKTLPVGTAATKTAPEVLVYEPPVGGVVLLRVHGFRIDFCRASFLSYTMTRTNPTLLTKVYPVLVRGYLRCPFLWWVFGKQFLVVASKVPPTTVLRDGRHPEREAK